jgi:hypothetical protein
MSPYQHNVHPVLSCRWEEEDLPPPAPAEDSAEARAAREAAAAEAQRLADQQEKEDFEARLRAKDDSRTRKAAGAPPPAWLLVAGCWLLGSSRYPVGLLPGTPRACTAAARAFCCLLVSRHPSQAWPDLSPPHPLTTTPSPLAPPSPQSTPLARPPSGSSKADAEEAKRRKYEEAADKGTMINMLRDVSRQEYLKKREEAKVQELEDEVIDAEYLFAGQRLTARELADLEHKKQLLALVKERQKTSSEMAEDRWGWGWGVGRGRSAAAAG